MRNYYQILNVDENSDFEEIKASYRKLALHYHPDKNRGKAEYEERFKEINLAYDVLKDPVKRREYDSELRQKRRFKEETFNSRFSYEDIVSDIMSRGFSTNPFYERNKDVIVNYTITLEQAFSGLNTEIKFKVGSESRSMKVNIPPGIEDGSQILYKGKGESFYASQPPGDLRIKVSVAKHPRFLRQGLNLISSTVITYLDAILGCIIPLTTIDGKTIKVKVPPNILPGQTLKISGKGMPGNNGQQGDLLVEVVLKSPDLSAEQRKVLENFRDSL